MFLRLLLLFILFAGTELTLLLWVASRVGFLVTVLIILSTAILGVSLTRWQGLRAWIAIQGDLAAGRMPAASVIDGLMILIAGTFLLTPGLISDACGFLLLVPPVRAVIGRRLVAFLKGRVGTRFQMYTARRSEFTQGEVIDAEFRRTDATPIEDRTLEDRTHR